MTDEDLQSFSHKLLMAAAGAKKKEKHATDEGKEADAASEGNDGTPPAPHDFDE